MEKDFHYFIDHQEELVKKYLEKQLVIHMEKVVASFNNVSDAYFYGKENYGLGNFLIQLCIPGEEAYTQKFHSRILF